MPVDYKNYPGWWKQFSEWVRRERAGDKCEQCKAPNGEIVARGYIAAGIPFWANEGLIYNALTGEVLARGVREYEIRIDRYSKIVLTVAHLDHEGGICDCKERTGRKCARADHCLALCQRCHLSLDHKSHLAVRRKTLAKRKDSERGLFNEIL